MYLWFLSAKSFLPFVFFSILMSMQIIKYEHWFGGILILAVQTLRPHCRSTDSEPTFIGSPGGSWARDCGSSLSKVPLESLVMTQPLGLSLSCFSPSWPGHSHPLSHVVYSKSNTRTAGFHGNSGLSSEVTGPQKYQKCFINNQVFTCSQLPILRAVDTGIS